MAKSSSNSELYGALAPTTGCKKPAAIISFARPTIPATSKWSVMDAETKAVSTWYMKLGADDELPLMRFERQIKECEKSVVVGNGPTTSTWTETDAAMCMEPIECPNATIIASLFDNVTTCAEYKAYATTLRETEFHGEQTGCTHLAKPETTELGSLETSILDVKSDGTAVWEIGIWIMEVSAAGVPTGIKSNGDARSAFDQVLSVEDFDATGTTIFDMCVVGGDTVTEARRLDTTRRVLKTKHKRVLAAWHHSTSKSQYCGGKSAFQENPCPWSRTDASCRLHDFGKRAKKLSAGYRMECAIDYNLVRNVGLDKSAAYVVGMFQAKRSPSSYWGCYAYGSYSTVRWVPSTRRCGWRGCRGKIGWWRLVRVDGELILYGKSRYDGAAKGNLYWGYRYQGKCGTTTCREKLCQNGAWPKNWDYFTSSGGGNKNPSWSTPHTWGITCPKPNQYAKFPTYTRRDWKCPCPGCKTGECDTSPKHKC
jgi:hypothetical protein